MGHRILCYGDSNTYGYDPRSCLGGRYPSSVRWTSLLERQGWEVINAGENGRTIPRTAREAVPLAQDIRRLAPDILTVMLGSNDLLQDPGLSAGACGERMAGFLGTLPHADPGSPCRFLLVAPPPMALGAWIQEEAILEASRQLAGTYEQVASRLGISFANAGDWGIGLAFDGVHFSPEGHLAFAAGVSRALATPGVLRA